VIACTTILLNPVEVAVVELSKKSLALWEQATVAELGKDRGAPQSFTQTLSGCVDAAVAGGVSNYEPLLTGSFRTSHPEIARDLEKVPGKHFLIQKALLPALQAHVAVLKRSVAVHRDKCAPDMLPLHKFLEERLKQVCEMVDVWTTNLMQ
jgi:hypothetical protein